MKQKILSNLSLVGGLIFFICSFYTINESLSTLCISLAIAFLLLSMKPIAFEENNTDIKEEKA